MNNSRYQKYYNRIVDVMSKETFDKLTEAEVNKLFVELLQCLPNNGKLYKYRNFLNSNHAFDNTYNSLREGYIWIADAQTMNDKVDVTLNVSLIKERERIERFLIKNKEQLLLKLINEHLGKNKIWYALSNEQIREIMRCYTSDGRAIKKRIKTVLLKSGGTHRQADMIISTVANYVTNFLVQQESMFKRRVEDVIATAHMAREKLKLFCLAEKPTIESMWAYYGNSSNGFCIEYDLRKAENCNFEIKKVILNLFKVKYLKKKPTFSLVEIMENLVLEGSINDDYRDDINKRFYQQMLTKSSDWKHEQEWRIIVNLPVNKFYVDLVSAIYIDESMINTSKGQKLMHLARKRGWKVIERKLSATRSAFVYTELKH